MRKKPPGTRDDQNVVILCRILPLLPADIGEDGSWVTSGVVSRSQGPRLDQECAVPVVRCLHPARLCSAPVVLICAASGSRQDTPELRLYPWRPDGEDQAESKRRAADIGPKTLVSRGCDKRP